MPNVTEASLDRYTTRPMPQVEGVEHCFIEAGGVDIHVAVAGEGAPVLLIHGYPQHWFLWRRLIPALARERRVISPDLRGFGWSEAPAEGYDKETLTRDVLAVMDRLGIERVPVVGHDWGGWIGFLLCLRAPERFDRFLALGIVHPWQTPGGWRDLPRYTYQQVIAAPGLGYALHRRGAFVRLALRRGTADPATFDDRTAAAFADNLAQPARARACVRMYRTFLTRELLPLIRGRYLGTRLRVPTHLVLGTGDPVLTERRLAGYEQHTDSMTAEMIADCGHFIADERSDVVLDRARELFA